MKIDIPFSIIIPVYNRPAEIKELLESLFLQTRKNFEILIIEDGSTVTCKEVVDSFMEILPIRYYYKENSGPGLARNYGAERALCDFFVFFDSDCIIPPDYFEIINQCFLVNEIECYGGTDRAHSSFTDTQKAIDYTMTSLLTTGGIRGGSRKVTRFYPRSFNMGFSKKVFQITNGYSSIRFGEDVDLSIRIEQAGFKLYLLNEAFVYHKRRVDFKKFFKQIYNSGIARINLFKLYPHSLKITHFFPLCFLIFLVSSIVTALCINAFLILPLLFYLLLILFHATYKYQSLKVGLTAVLSVMVQMTAYGLGFWVAFWKRIILRKDAFSAFGKNFYK
jgi:glycosyltransferase involved in cell wall biosynthesis